MKGRSLSAFFHELKSIITTRKLLVAVLAVATVPLLYSSIFLWAFWDPYGKLNDLPVAVVNDDRGATFEGKFINVGKDFVDKIKDSNDFNWQFVSKEEADQGLHNRKYYLAIEIPDNFSENATKVLDDNPVPSILKFVPNESMNFLSSQIGKTAMERMKSEISKELTRSYTQAVFDNLGQVSDGLKQAANGAGQLADGTKKVEDGLIQVDQNLGRLIAEGTLPLQDGIKKLLAGATQLTDGTTQLKQGTGQLAEGMSQLDAASRQLQQGAAQLKGGTAQLKQGAGELNQGAAQLKQGLDGSAAGLEKLAQGAAGLSGGLEKLAAAQPELAKTAEFQQLLAAGKQLASGADSAAKGQQQLAAGAGSVAGGAAKLAEGANGAAQGSAQLDAGLAQFGGKLAEAAQGAKAADAGAAGVAQGAAQLQGGLAQVSDGAAKLSDNTAKLKAEGTDKLTEGMTSVVSGTNELSTKLSDAAQKTGDIKAGDNNYDMFASPVKVDEEKATSVPNYGTGFAPYFLSLGLLVGALMLTIVFSVRKSASAPSSGIAMFVSKFGLMLVVGLIQATLADLILLYGLGMEVQSIPLFFLFSVLTSWTFMALLQFLVTLLDDAGRFVAVLLLILQLTTSAGTFPLELIPTTLQKFNAFLPMTYSVAGFKAVISSGQYEVMWNQAAVLGLFLIGLALGTLAYWLISFNHNKQTAEPVPA